jgi:tetratricopeptide (TPR) repeat protein
MGFYDAGLELAETYASLIVEEAELQVYYNVQALRCQCLGVLGRPAEIEPLLYDLLSRSPDPRWHMYVSFALAMLYSRIYGAERRDHRRALAHVNNGIAIASLLEDPDDRVYQMVFLNNGKALVEMDGGNLEESLRLLNEGIGQLDHSLAPDKNRLSRSVLNLNRAQALIALDRKDEALADFARVIDADPNFPDHRFNRGNLLYTMGRNAEAMADYEACARLTPPFPELYYNRGDLRAATGDVAGAIDDFRYVLDLEPDYVEARVSLATLLLDAGDPKAAVAEVKAGLAITAGEARLHCTLGLALLDLANYQEARECFDQALQLDPELTEALVNRAVAAYAQGQFDAAVTDLTAALECGPCDPDVLYNRGLALEAAGRREDAITDYTLALRDPEADRATLLYQRGRCHAALGSPQEARRDFDAHLALGPSPYEREIRDLR